MATDSPVPLHLFRLDRELETTYMRPGTDPALRTHCWRLHAELVRLGVRRKWTVPENNEIQRERSL